MNRVLKHLGCQYPILQSPMGWIARSQLASAVSDAGGFGMIETSSGEVDNCKQEILKMREITDKPFGVNLPLMLLADDQMIDFVAQQKIRFVTTSAGNPEKYIKRLKDAGIITYHAVANLKGALKAIKAGVDGLIVEGSEGGGFKNPDEVSLLVLLQAIRAHSDIPMIAAGGIVDGNGMAAAFALGAEAVQMGTRFVSCQESPVHENFKQAIVDCEDTGTVIVNRNGRPILRALKTESTNAFVRVNKMPDDTLWKIQQLYFDGDMEASVAIAGQSAGLINQVDTARQIIENTIEQFFSAQQKSAERATKLSF
jgi:enoyl-[acyl-carrier protein] reductase II